jgi:hypothetical protein
LRHLRPRTKELSCRRAPRRSIVLAPPPYCARLSLPLLTRCCLNELPGHHSLTFRPLRLSPRLSIASCSVRDLLCLLLGRFNKGATTLIARVTAVQAAQSRSHSTEHLLSPEICPAAALHNLGLSLHRLACTPDQRLNSSIASSLLDLLAEPLKLTLAWRLSSRSNSN